MKIAIIGTRGIPNHYGGFEQFAEYFAVYLSKRGHQVYVYCPHNHPFTANIYLGVHLVKCYDPEYRIGTVGQFIYDLNCIAHTRKLRPDTILNLGYTSSAIFMRLFRKSAPVVTNMDGLEWKRSKYSKGTQRFIKYSESLAVKRSSKLIADSPAIREYIRDTYGAESVFIPYGAEPLKQVPDVSSLAEFRLKPGEYNVVIARMEPENNIEVILQGVREAANGQQTLIIGNYGNRYGAYLKNKFSEDQFWFFGPYYNLDKLNAIRYYCSVYFHGHSVGGTNPSLLEAMASGAFICANDNPFNRVILGDDAAYFSGSADVAMLLRKPADPRRRREAIENNFHKIATQYTWDSVNEQYEQTLLSVAGRA